eukprot:3600442-Pleurochrysis_carterae.AAC.2
MSIIHILCLLRLAPNQTHDTSTSVFRVANSARCCPPAPRASRGASAMATEVTKAKVATSKLISQHVDAACESTCRSRLPVATRATRKLGARMHGIARFERVQCAMPTNLLTCQVCALYQGHDSFELIFMMLMGIRTAVGKFASATCNHVGPQEFNQKWEGDFVGQGSPETPAHSHADFKFKDYAPLVFRQLRERFGITAQDYMLSLTSE